MKQAAHGLGRLFDDNTEIVHSEMLPDNRVKVYVEKPDAKDCFHDMICYLPSYEIESEFITP